MEFHLSVSFWTGLGIGLALGIVIILALALLLMPGLMIQSVQSKYRLDETLTRIEAAVEKQGWTVQSTVNMNESMEKHGRHLDPQVRVLKLCHPDYAKEILMGDRHLSTMMPCSISVYEADDGTIMISQINSGLFGKLFGGTVAEVMSGKVAPDVDTILKSVTAD